MKTTTLWIIPWTCGCMDAWQCLGGLGLVCHSMRVVVSWLGGPGGSNYWGLQATNLTISTKQWTNGSCGWNLPYCLILNNIVLYCTVQYSTVLFNTLLYCTVLYRVQYSMIILYMVILHSAHVCFNFIVMYCTLLYSKKCVNGCIVLYTVLPLL